VKRFLEEKSDMTLTYTWYGHGTSGLEVDGINVVVDPYFTDNPAATIKAEDVEADYILITHGHGDHVADAVSIAKRTGAMLISNFEIATWLQNQGVEAHGQHIGGGHDFPIGYVKLTLALHGSALPDGSDGGNPCGILITTPGGQKVYLAGDTGLFGDMALIGEEMLDLAVIPIGDNYTMGPDDALRAVKLLKSKHVIPGHYNTWELIEQDADAWAERVRSETDTESHVLQPGDTFTL
jgi:L-ascorbate metabolism protein UlaG (beta-lactamase superfamily)